MAGLPNIGIERWRFSPSADPADNLSRLQQFVDSVANAFKRFTDVGLINCVRLRGVAIVAGTPKVIAHGLGRLPQGWYVTRVVAAGAVTVYETASAPPTVSMLTLNATANVTVDVVVF